MEVFTTLLLKLTPLYFTIFLGYLAGRFLHVRSDAIASLMFYVIVPIVIFTSVINVKISLDALFLPILVFCICSSISIIFLHFGGKFLKDGGVNVMALGAGYGNIGYFGMPVAMILFDEQILSLYVLCLMGGILYENSTGFYIAAKGSYASSECIKKVLRLPTIYAFFAGLIVGTYEFIIPEIFESFVVNIRGAYTTLGMMIVGFGIASVKGWAIDMRFLSISFFAKFIVWPLLMFGIIFIDSRFLHFFSEDIYPPLILLSIVPMSANAVVIATLLKAHPEKAATAVLASTIFALLYMPLMITLFL